MNAPRSVVVTGIGATTPLGGTAEATWRAALDGASGAAPMAHDWVAEHNLPVTFAAEIHTEPSEILAKHELKKLDRSGQFAVISAREAWAHSGIDSIEPERLGVTMSTGIGGVWTLLNAYEKLKDKGPRGVLPMTVPMLMANGAAGAVALELKARAGTHCASSACASGAEGMADALAMIRTGRADVVLAGGTEACIHPLPISAFAAMRALSTDNDAPATASRPFCETRNGFVLGEGAASLVLEAEEHAVARGATIYARVLGAGLTSDAHHIAAPEPTGAGARRAVEGALADGGIQATDVVHVNAHATSTPAGDVAEGAALRGALGDHVDNVIVTSTKSATGHLLGGAGALESVFSVLALHHGVCPPTINVKNLDPAVNLNVALDKPHDIPAGVAINNSFGFGGHNVAIAFGSA